MNSLNHLAIIMDGNGRWAKSRRHSRVFGHVRGMKTVRKIVTKCSKEGIAHLTLFAFSSENWNRPEFEVKALMKILKKFLIQEQSFLMKNNIKLSCIGEVERLPQDIQALLSESIQISASNTGLELHLAISYGSQQEILRASQALAKKCQEGLLSWDQITTDDFNSELYTGAWPNPDLIIRTSGEFRLSNFLLFQAAYSEIYVSNKNWPDFTDSDLDEAISKFTKTERRFGSLLDTKIPVQTSVTTQELN